MATDADVTTTVLKIFTAAAHERALLEVQICAGLHGEILNGFKWPGVTSELSEIYMANAIDDHICMQLNDYRDSALA